MAGEIRELQTALKEADAARRDAENRAQRALAELQQLRIEMERRLQEKEEEMEALRCVRLRRDICMGEYRGEGRDLGRVGETDDLKGKVE